MLLGRKVPTNRQTLVCVFRVPVIHQQGLWLRPILLFITQIAEKCSSKCLALDKAPFRICVQYLQHYGQDIAQALVCKGWDHPIDPAWQVHLQFGLFSIRTSG